MASSCVKYLRYKVIARGSGQGPESRQAGAAGGAGGEWALSEQEPAQRTAQGQDPGSSRRSAGCATSALRERASVFSDEIDMDFRTACRTAAEAGCATSTCARWGASSRMTSRRLAGAGRRHGRPQPAPGCRATSANAPSPGRSTTSTCASSPILVEQAHFFGTDVIRVFPSGTKSSSTRKLLPGGAASQPPAGAAGDRAPLPAGCGPGPQGGGAPGICRSTPPTAGACRRWPVSWRPWTTPRGRGLGRQQRLGRGHGR